jgi:hypothetical protein
MPDEDLRDHCNRVIKAMAEGWVTPILGAGVNLYNRPPNVPWVPGDDLPNAVELAGYLAKEFGYPQDEVLDLMRVSEYAYVMSGIGPLYEKLHRLFDADFPISPVYQFLAKLPRELKKANQPPRYQLIITTNYDDGLERAFSEEGERFDLVSYIAEGDDRGKFVHSPPEGEPIIIMTPNEYHEVRPDEQTVILKIHGAVARATPESEQDSYVITEDHYIDYLTNTEAQAFIPAMLGGRLKRSSLLFLGYSMRDWNLRVILNRIWKQRGRRYQPWAIQQDPDDLDRRFWQKRGVEVYNASLEDYVPALKDALAELQGVSAGP